MVKLVSLRQARRKFGSRSTRRRGTNGKHIPGRPAGKSGRVVAFFKNPRPTRNISKKIHAYMKAANAKRVAEA